MATQEHNTTPTDRRRLTPDEAAEYLGIHRRTLDNWRWSGRGPAYLKLGQRVRYRISDLDAWENQVHVKPAAG